MLDSTPHATGVYRLKNFQISENTFSLHSSVILMMNAKILLDNGKWKQNKMFENKRIPNLKNKMIKVVFSLVSTILYIRILGYNIIYS